MLESERRDVAPVISKEKLHFFYRRWTETFLGGVKFCGPEAFLPAAIVTFQLVLFLIPPALCAVFLMLSTKDTILVYGFASGFSISLLVVFISFVASKILKQGAIANLKPAVYSNEEELDYEGFFSPESVSFLFPQKSNSVLFFHSLFSFALSTLVTITIAQPNMETIWTVFCLFTFATCHLSLILKPPIEPAEWGSTVPTVRRSITVVFLFCLFLLLGLHKQCIEDHEPLCAAQQSILIAIAALPLLWTLAIIPSLDVLLEWSIEQVLINFLGGSSCSSRKQVLCAFSFGAIPFAIAFLWLRLHPPFFLSSVFSLCVLWGVVLARGPGIATAKALQPHYQNASISPSPLDVTVNTKKQKETLTNGFHLGIAIKAIFMDMLLAGAYAAFTFIPLIVSVGVKDFSQSFSIALLLLWLFDFTLAIVSRPIWFRRFHSVMNQSQSSLLNESQNLWYSGSNSNKKMSTLRFVLLTITRISLVVGISIIINDKVIQVSDIIIAIGITRLGRIIFQNTRDAAFQVALSLLIPSSFWNTIGIPPHISITCIFTGFVVNRIPILSDTIHFFFVYTVTAWTHKKLRLRHNHLGLIWFILTLPITLVVIVVAVLLNAPLLPLLGMPIYILGFPRPLRQWQSFQDTVSGSSEASFYRLLQPQLQTILPNILSTVCFNVRPGTTLLFRLEKMLGFIQVIETGMDYTRVVIRGLELQEPTSCHAVEAGVVDDIFSQAFEPHRMEQRQDEAIKDIPFIPDLENESMPQIVRKTQGNQSSVLPFSYPFHMAHPIAQAKITAYSSSHMSLSGILDNKDVLAMIPVAFKRTLVWVIAHYLDQSQPFTDLPMPIGNTLDEKVPLSWRSTPLYSQDLENVLTRFPHQWTRFVWAHLKYVTQKTHEMWNEHPANEFVKISNETESTTNRDQNGQECASLSKHESTTAHTPPPNPTPVFAVPSSQIKIKKSMVGLLDAIDDDMDDIEDLIASVLPEESKIPMEGSHDVSYSPEKPIVAQSKEEKQEQPGHFSVLVCTCYFIVEQAVTWSVGSAHVRDIFHAKIPPSLELDWLNERTELKELVLRAYRLAFKVVLDDAVMGIFGYGDEEQCDVINEDRQQEIAQQLQEVEKSCYIGVQGSAEWNAHIDAKTPNLLSLTHGSAQAMSATHLSLQPEQLQIALFNFASIQGIWSSLSLELLYFTSDDDERYSIQAHKSVLRNLIVQSANPPLGYPVFISSPIQV